MSHRYIIYNARIELIFGERGVLVVCFEWLKSVFEILRFCRITLQFSVFSYVLLRFSLLTTPVHVVRKTLVKHMRIPKIANLYDKNSKSQIQILTIRNKPLTLHTHQISTRSEHYKSCTGETNFALDKTYDFPHLPGDGVGAVFAAFVESVKYKKCVKLSN